ncbi:hypothetical protein ACLB2K_035637 [Fragaria x ananassa]
MYKERESERVRRLCRNLTGLWSPNSSHRPRDSGHRSPATGLRSPISVPLRPRRPAPRPSQIRRPIHLHLLRRLSLQTSPHADKAIALDSKDAAAHILIALALDTQGFKTSALDAIDVALSPLCKKSLFDAERGDALYKRAEIKISMNWRAWVDGFDSGGEVEPRECQGAVVGLALTAALLFDLETLEVGAGLRGLDGSHCSALLFCCG